MSFIDCIQKAVLGQELDEAAAGRAIDYYQRMLKKHQAAGKADAEILAAKEATEDAGREAMLKARNKYLKFNATKNIYEQIRDYRTPGTGRAKPHEAGVAILDSTGLSGKPGVNQIHKEYRKRAHSMLSSFMNEQHKNVLGNSPDPVGLANVVDEIFGKDSGDAVAKKMAQAWNDTAEYLRLEFNRAGGDIKFRKDWGLPQMHDWKRIRNTNKDSWVAALHERYLDIEKMSELYNMTSEEIKTALGKVHENISSNGANKVDFDAMGFRKATSNNRLDSRFMVFKDSEQWMQYQKLFGNGDPYSVMMGHIDMMSRDIAVMKKLGPNPTNGVEVVKQTIRKFNTELGSDNNYDAAVQDIWEVITGESNIPVNSALAKAGANTRQVLTAAQLGSAVVSAVTDPFFTAMTASFNGLPVTKVFKRITSTMNSQSHEQMVRLGLTSESWADVAADLARYHDEALSSTFFQKLSSGVLRASGLNYWTDVGRWSFERELLGFISENAKNSFTSLPKELQRSLSRYSISPEEWEIIRATPQYDVGGGAMYLRTQDIAKRTDISRIQADDLSLKLAGFIDNETNFAIPTGSLRGKASWGTRGQPGTFWGEVTRSGMMYKNFPITLVMTHLRRSFDELAQGRAGYATTFLVGSTVVGALATQLKETKDGKTPSDMTNPQFWVRAFLQGGGLGIYGDFILRDHNRYGGGPQDTIAGPGVGALHDAFKIGQSLFWDAPIEGNYQQNIAKAGALATNYVPGRSMWYLSAPYKRAFQDNLRAMGDKKPGRRFKKMLKDRKTKENAGYWWNPGETTPF